MTRESQRCDKQSHGEFQDKVTKQVHESGSREKTGGARMWLGCSTSYRTVRANLSFSTLVTGWSLLFKQSHQLASPLQ